MSLLFEKEIVEERPRYSIVPRPYQHDGLDETFRLFDSGVPGVLLRAFTGSGKTILSLMIADRWLQRGSNYRVMVVSYERQLVHQWSEETQDVLGLTPGIEMADEEIDPLKVPPITISSRATLQQHALATEEQLAYFRGIGIEDVGLCNERVGKRLINYHKRAGDVDGVRVELDEWNRNYRCDHDTGRVSRVHKFDWALNWLVIYDEAHRHVMKLTSVGHLVEWFERNPESRRCGATATPKRADGVSLKKMFPGVAIDFPLIARDRPCAVSEGWAVPYTQKFIRVHNVDFREIKQLCGNSQSKRDFEMAKRLEMDLATVCEPMLDLVENRRTLIFSPSVAMARHVSDYINARAKCRCECGRIQWHPSSYVSDGAQCKQCRTLLVSDHVIKTPEMQCHALWGEIPDRDRQPIYKAFEVGDFQFLSVCALAREGYNNPSVQCVAIFRPVSKAASSLAEQMKGRGCRPLRNTVEGLALSEERLAAIAASEKPDCMIIDLCGITGLGDCATTVQLYAEGLDDEIVQRAERLVLGGVDDVQDAIEQAETQVAEERERRRVERERREQRAREQAEQRARARAEVEYSTHDVGHDVGNSRSATEKQMNYIRFLGMDVHGCVLSKYQAGRMITQLRNGERPTNVAYTNGIKDTHWDPVLMSSKQRWALRNVGVPFDANCTPYEASKLIDAAKNGGTVSTDDLIQRIQRAQNNEELSRYGRLAANHRASYSDGDWARIVSEGRERREVLQEEF